MTELTVTRTLAAPQERVWRAFTRPDELATWLWPGSWEATASVDLRVGGRYRIASAPIGMAVGGEYVAVEPVSRLVQTWQWDGEADETLVTITLAAVEGGTLLTIVHERFASDEDAASHRQGWNDCLDRLPTHLAAPDAGAPAAETQE
jgi:uncharacterized protein YndB with AHSA1/START domain